MLQTRAAFAAAGCDTPPMESRTARRDRPPQIPLPKVAQTARFMVRPLPFLEHWRRRLGETFGAQLLGPGEIYFISDPPSIKSLFAADRVNTIAPGREFVLQPLLGSGSLLLQHDPLAAVALDNQPALRVNGRLDRDPARAGPGGGTRERGDRR